MKRLISLLGVVSLLVSCAGRPDPGVVRTEVSVRKIWDKGTHAAFTSLEKFQGKYYCSFREGYSHVFDEQGNAEGHVRILCSADGESWESVADIGMAGVDLRDPKLSITPDGRLMVIIGGSVYRDRKLVECRPQVCFSKDGKTFSPLEAVQVDPAVRSDFDWLWRVTWHEGVGYAVTYRREEGVLLLKTLDGIHFDPVSLLKNEGFMNESTVRFLPDGRMAVMVRRDPGTETALLAVAPAPFTQWTWHEMPLHVGGPDFLVRPDGSLIVGGRSQTNPSHCKTVLYKGTADGGLDERYVLPSDGDNSYPGLLVEGDELWVSYYSTDKVPGKAAIFLAKLPLGVFD